VKLPSFGTSNWFREAAAFVMTPRFRLIPEDETGTYQDYCAVLTAREALEINAPYLASELAHWRVTAGNLDSLVRFLETELAMPITEYDFKGIRCFFASFGTEADRADRAILHLLVQVFSYSPSAKFTCEVYDEGPLSTVKNYRAPPGGWGPASGETLEKT
jgi:hypothetical protein